MLGALLTLLVLGAIAVVAVGAVVALIGLVISVTLGIVGFMLFKVAPLLLIGWVVLKVVRRSQSRRSIAKADQKWLDG